MSTLAADLVEIQIERIEMDRIARIVRWVAATISVLAITIVSILLTIPYSALVPMNRIVCQRKGTRDILFSGDAPPLRTRKLASVMKTDASTMSEGEFLAKWSDSEAWVRLLREKDLTR